MQFNLHKTFSTPHGGGGPGAGPVAVAAPLEPYLPRPRLVRRGDRLELDHDRPASIGRIRSFHGNFGILVRALAYVLRLGGPGLAAVTRLAVLNANYVRARLRGILPLAYETPVMHEAVFSDRDLNRHGVTTLDVAKRLLDHGFYAPTIYFPLVVKGALMIEPTESESKEAIDEFLAAVRAIVAEAERDPEVVRSAPHRTWMGRLDEVAAARRPRLRWRPPDDAPASSGEN
jgi:glycine dehydrogenase subunit 2